MTQVHQAPDAVPENTRSSRPLVRLRSRAERQADAEVARVRHARARIEADRLRAQATVERLENEREMVRLRADLAAEQSALDDVQRSARRGQLRAVTQRITFTITLASANVGVNATAVLGQVLALVLGLGWAPWQALPVALIVESVAINVGYLAHDKMIKGYSAAGLRLMSYGIGSAVGLFNYAHNSDIVATSDFALVFGGASFLSPVLWQIYSRWRHWEDLREQGALERRAPAFGLRWVTWPGETFYLWRRAVRYGVADRATADERFRPEYEARGEQAPVDTEPVNAEGDIARLADETQALNANLTASHEARSTIANLVMLAADATGRRVSPRDHGASLGQLLPFPSTRLAINPSDPRPVGTRTPLLLWSRPEHRPLVNGVLPPPSAPEKKDDSEEGRDRGRGQKTPTEQDRKNVVRHWIMRAERGEILSKRELATATRWGPTWCGERIAEGRQILLDRGWTTDARGRLVKPAALVATANGSATA